MNFENAYEIVLFPSDQSPGVGGQGVWPGHCALGVHYSADDEDDVIPFCSDTKTPKKGTGTHYNGSKRLRSNPLC